MDCWLVGVVGVFDVVGVVGVVAAVTRSFPVSSFSVLALAAPLEANRRIFIERKLKYRVTNPPFIERITLHSHSYITGRPLPHSYSSDFNRIKF